MATTVETIIGASQLKYAGTTGKVGETVLHFKDGTTLRLDGHYVLQVGTTYAITYNGDQPVEPTAIIING